MRVGESLQMKTIEDLISKYEKCSKIRKHKIKKGEIISNFIPNRTQFGVIIDGCADLIRYDIDGNRTIVERLYKGDMFGEIFHLFHSVNELFVEAKTNVVVLQLDYLNASEKCNSLCPIHDEIKQIVFDMFISKIVNQNTRVEILTQRTMRDKILAYFDVVSLGGMKKKFTLPFSYTDLADYLNVDRSAMTREIANLIDDGFIKKDNKTITLLY